MNQSQNDVFQFYESSADAAPGKGTGETLHSPSDTYADLRKVKGWRKILAGAESSKTLSDETKTILPLTQNAELWYVKGKAKSRASFLENQRLAQRTSLEHPTEGGMQGISVEKPSNKKNTTSKNKNKKNLEAQAQANAQGNLGSIPEGALASASPSADADVGTSERQESGIRFCPVCRYYLYLEVVGEEQILNRLCRNCGHREEDTKGGMVMEMMVQERSAEGYKILLNEFTRQDPRLPHIRKNIKCPEPTCDSNHGNKDPDIIYIKYDAVNMLYLYICDVCGFQWRSAR